MDPLRWDRLDRLFAFAEKLDSAARAQWLAESFAAEPDPELERELAEMLAAAGAEAKVDGVIASGLAIFAREDGMPAWLGPYRLRGEIGRGGMATVYEAERADQEFERKVAVKVLRPGMDSADLVRRLRRERQILADLDHPNIARLLDGGSTADGRPYVVMEHIDGEPIDRYCRRRGLALPARLQLFCRICDAVHFAHRNLVLHRDIKPSNILVTAEGQPKLLDFGIAKVLQEDDAEDPIETEPTLTGLRLLTPEWASPEQVRGAPLSIASDVYSLGLLLYLLVTGRRAYEVDARRAAELERVVCEEEPKSPGRGDDLDVILLAALRKEPARRYASAAQLGEDVRRFLENLPITARKDTLSYRAGKFIRRHRLLFLSVTLSLILLGAATILLLQTRETRELRAGENLAVYQKLASARDALSLLEQRATLKAEGAPRADRRPQGEEQATQADDLYNLGMFYRQRGEERRAEELLTEALALRRRQLGDGHPLVAQTLFRLGELLEDKAPAGAERYFLQALAIDLRALPQDDARIGNSLAGLGRLAMKKGDLDAAEKLFREEAALRRGERSR